MKCLIKKKKFIVIFLRITSNEDDGSLLIKNDFILSDEDY